MSPGGESPAAFRGKVAPSPTCSTWNTSATGPEGGATRLPLIGRRSLAGRASLTGRTGWRAQPAIGFPGRGERSCPSTSPPIPERHQRRCSRDSRRATARHRRSLRSGVPRRPLHPWRQGSPAGSLGELDLSVAWLAPARGYLRKRSPGSSAAIGCRVEVNAPVDVSRGATPEAAFERLSCLIHAPGTMQKRCGVMPTAVEPGLENPALSAVRVAREPGQSHSPAKQSQRSRTKQAHW